jgi:hypothetical protein
MPPFDDCEFVICIVVVLKPQTAEEKATTNETPSQREYVKRWHNGARDMFEYFRTINVSCMVITVEKANKGQGTDLSIDKLSDPGVQRCWEDQKKHPDDSFKKVLRRRVTFVAHDSLVENSGCMMRYDAGTSVLMELVGYLGVKTSQSILAGVMASGSDNQVLGRIRALERTIAQARKRAKSDTARILILNYRQTDYNVQHNANPDILEQITGLAKTRGISVIILPAVKYKRGTPAVTFDSTQHDVFYLYGQPGAEVKLSYGEKARFWADVARKANDWHLVGVIGGRSGSMDLPAFVGVRCLSWDEPFFQVEETSQKGSKWTFRGKTPVRKKDPKENVNSDDDGKAIVHPQKKRRSDSSSSDSRPPYNSDWNHRWADSQGRQILRLLNQIEITHVSFLKRDALHVEKKGKKSLRHYTALEEQDFRLQNFLSNTTNAPYIGLGFDAKPGWTVS